MQITITEREITVVAPSGWDEEEYAQAIRDHGLWDEIITFGDYRADENGERWTMLRGDA